MSDPDLRAEYDFSTMAGTAMRAAKASTRQHVLPTKRPGRSKIALEAQVRVFFRDGWMCRWCFGPTIFSPTLRLLGDFVTTAGYSGPLAYFHPRWRRDAAPLLDHLGAVIDHVEAYSKGGEHAEANFVTACNKCNMRKSARQADSYRSERPGTPVKGKFGEPRHWDGLASLFLVLADDAPRLSTSERAWKRVLETHMVEFHGRPP